MRRHRASEERERCSSGFPTRHFGPPVFFLAIEGRFARIVGLKPGVNLKNGFSSELSPGN
jgi:hypothetical protein